jgi:hypothetical protein
VLTDDQIDTPAQLFAWLVNTENVPSELAEHKADRGLGYHRMFGIGDHACPGTKVIAQRQDILDLANAAYIYGCGLEASIACQGANAVS